jgi:hypothetical protein
MLPAGVWMCMLACPVPVIRTEDIPCSLPNCPRRRYNKGSAHPPAGVMTDFVEANPCEGADVAGDHDAPVTSPDQHKPANMKALRIGAVVTAIILLLMIMGNHTGRVEDIFLVLSAGALILMLIIDWMLRRNGLRS